MVDKNVKWLNTDEYIAQMSVFTRVLYRIGVIKQKRFLKLEGNPYQIYTGGFYRSMFGFRWWHPLSIVIAIVVFAFTFIGCVFGAFAESLKVTSELDRQPISIAKPLKREV